MNWGGVWVALVTPFRLKKVDVSALEKLVIRLMEANVNGIVPCATTGEGSALTDEEFSQVIQTVLKCVNEKIPVVPGTGSNNTEHTIHRTKLAKKLGAQGALVVTPYYVKPPQEGLCKHYERIVEETDFSLMLYNVPGRTAVNMLPETVEKLSKDSRICAIKECASLPQVSELILRVGKKMSVLSGEDAVFLPFLSLGGHGIVSVVANLIPIEWVYLYEQFVKGNLNGAQQTFLKFASLVEVLFVESNPIPLKAAMARIGLIEEEVRLPLSNLSENNISVLERELAKHQLVKL